MWHTEIRWRKLPEGMENMNRKAERVLISWSVCERSWCDPDPLTSLHQSIVLIWLPLRPAEIDVLALMISLWKAQQADVSEHVWWPLWISARYQTKRTPTVVDHINLNSLFPAIYDNHSDADVGMLFLFCTQSTHHFILIWLIAS